MAEVRMVLPRMHCHGVDASLTPYAHVPELVASLRKLALDISRERGVGTEIISEVARVLEECGKDSMNIARKDLSLRAEATRTFERMWEGTSEPA